MGWDAFSSAYNSTDKNSIKALEAFSGKITEISKLNEDKHFEDDDFINIDAGLRDGYLNLRGCRDIIQEYTDIGCYTDLTAEQVEEKYRDFPDVSIIDKDRITYYYSAKAFLEVCVEYNLSLIFSY